jgi:CBS-domain-containing membrane protein
VTIEPEAGLDLALEKLAGHNVSWMPVVEGLEAVVIGTISAADISKGYRRALKQNAQRLRGITTSAP